MTGSAPQSSILGDSYFRLSSKSENSFEAWRARSSQISNANWVDSSGTEFYEPWLGLTNWSSNTGIQVNGGRLYANSGSGTTGGINKSFALNSNQSARIVVPFTYVTNGGGGGILIGVSSDTPGAVPANAGTSAEGLYFQGATIQSWNKGTGTNIVTGLTINQTYVGRITITVDPSIVSIVYAVDSIAASPTTTEYRTQFARSNMALNNLYILFTTSQNLSGSSVGPLVARQAMSTSTRSYGIEAAGRNVQWTQVTGPNAITNNVKIVTPPAYDSRIPTPAVLMFHGNGSNESLFSDNAGQSPAYTAFLNSGYILISTAYSANGSSWGVQAALDANYAALQYARDHYNISSIGFYGNSMGGIESLLCLADRRIPGVAWWVGMSATYSLYNNYVNQAVAAPFTTLIDSAFGDTLGTLSSAVSAGAASISSSANYGIGTTVIIDASGSNPEQVVVGASSGSGPFTLQIAPALKYPHSIGAALSNFPTKSAGFDPSLMDPRAFRGVPMLIMAALDGSDTAVNQAANSASLASAVAPWASEVIVPPNISGGHAWNMNGAISGMAYSGAGTYAGLMIAFANKYSGN